MGETSITVVGTAALASIIVCPPFNEKMFSDFYEGDCRHHKVIKGHLITRVSSNPDPGPIGSIPGLRLIHAVKYNVNQRKTTLVKLI